MNFRIRYSTVIPMLGLIKKLKEGNLSESELSDLLDSADYKMEFERYSSRVSKSEFANYLFNARNLDEKDIENEDLRAHHSNYLDLLDNLDYYKEKTEEFKILKPELFEEQIKVALKGLPDDIKLPELNFIITIGIGQSFGYVHKNNMHFDYLQLVKNNSMEEFFSVISHEVHHVAMDTIYEEIGIDSLPLEHLFYLYFTGEGLAVKYCNNAEGVLSRSIYDGPKNNGLDNFTWEYLNNDFSNTFERFIKTIEDIRSSKISSREELEKELVEYWMNPYIEGQKKNEVPKLKHFRLYSFGNDIWGIIHDVFGKDYVFDIIRDLKRFPEAFNKALDMMGAVEGVKLRKIS